MYITKTDYLEYLFCRKNLWLKKHKPELFLDIELSDFEKKIIEEGNIADKDARNLFPKGFTVKTCNEESLLETLKALENNMIIFQGAFKWESFFVRSDILVYNKEENAYELYEVKAVNKVKNDKKHNHIKDLAFQKIIIENNNIKIYKCGVIHFNKEYQKQGEIDYNQLFLITDVSQDVLDIEEKVKEEMFEMKKYLEDSNEEKGCSCVYQGRSNHCSTFSYSNPEIPEYSVHDINRIGSSPKLLKEWIDKKIYNISDIDDVDKLKGSKKLQYLSYIKKEAIIDKEKIKEKLLSLNFPLQFFDYEGLTCAVPRFNGFSPYDQLPFQYSLHIMHESGEIEHKEFLITENKEDITRSLVEKMKEDLDERGSTIAWSTKYEKARNLILIVHGLEASESLRPLLRQLWRVLAPEGRIIVVAPNRASLWAQVDRSPFGHGRPFSRLELDGLLRDALFEPGQWDRALYAPPITTLTGSGAGWDRIGARLFPGIGGVHVVEAAKSLYAPAAPVRVQAVKKPALKAAQDFNRDAR